MMKLMRDNYAKSSPKSCHRNSTTFLLLREFLNTSDFNKKLESLILRLTGPLNKFVTQLFGNFSGERRQPSFGAATGHPVPINYRAHSRCLNVKIRYSKQTSQNTPINIHVLNAIVRNSHIFFVDNPKLLAKTSVSEFVAVKIVREFGPNKTQDQKNRNDNPQPVEKTQRKSAATLQSFIKFIYERRTPNTQNDNYKEPT